jgi:hypothetical protein
LRHLYDNNDDDDDDDDPICARRTLLLHGLFFCFVCVVWLIAFFTIGLSYSLILCCFQTDRTFLRNLSSAACFWPDLLFEFVVCWVILMLGRVVFSLVFPLVCLLSQLPDWLIVTTPITVMTKKGCSFPFLSCFIVILFYGLFHCLFLCCLVDCLVYCSLTPCSFAAFQQIESTRKKEFFAQLVIGCLLLARLIV